MRIVLLLTLLLAACNRQPGFDERYAATEQRLRAKSAEIDQALPSQPAVAADPASGGSKEKR